MQRGKNHIFLVLVFLVLAAVPVCGQVKLVSPEEGRRALEKMGSAPAAAKAPAAAPAAAPRPSRKTVLPERFAGWTGEPAQLISAFSAGTIAGDDAPILVECGFAGAETRRYTRNGPTLLVQALRMKDSSGSYGLYTFYRTEEWTTADTGKEQVAMRGDQLLIRKDEVLIRAAGARLSGDEVRALLADLASNGGGPLPTLPAFLPPAGLRLRSRKYILGPAAFSRVAKEFPAALVDFNLGAEATMARYDRPAGAMTMLLLSYPTPQLAALKIQSWQQSSSTASGTPVAVLYARRSGPLLGFVAGAPNHAAADSLLEQLRYTAEITWNEPVAKPQPNIRGFLINLFKFVGLLLLFAIFAGIGFGLVRIGAQILFPDQIFNRPEETEIIQLHINYLR